MRFNVILSTILAANYILELPILQRELTLGKFLESNRFEFFYYLFFWEVVMRINMTLLFSKMSPNLIKTKRLV